MSYKITFVLLFIFGNISAQKAITGKVLSQNDEPLENASVYFNNTSVGVISNKAGEFTISQPEGALELVVSYIGYETMAYKVQPGDSGKSLVFKVRPQSNMLDEVVIRIYWTEFAC